MLYYVYVHTQKSTGTLVARDSDIRSRSHHAPRDKTGAVTPTSKQDINIVQSPPPLDDHEFSTRRRFSRSS